MTTDFPTAPSAYGLNGPSANVTVEKSIHASHTEILTPPTSQGKRVQLSVRIFMFPEIPFLLPPSDHCMPTTQSLTNDHFGNLAPYTAPDAARRFG